MCFHSTMTAKNWWIVHEIIPLTQSVLLRVHKEHDTAESKKGDCRTKSTEHFMKSLLNVRASRGGDRIKEDKRRESANSYYRCL